MKELTILTGASRGMGQAIAKALMKEEAILITMQRHPCEALQEQAQACGCQLIQLAVDLADVQKAAQMMADTLALVPQWQSLDRLTLICNAGVNGPAGFAEDTSDDEFIFTQNVMALSPMVMTRRFLRETKDFKGKRRVLCISSGNGRNPVMALSAYGTAKASLDAFCRCAAFDETGKANPVPIVALAPGIIETDMQRHSRAEMALPTEVREKYIRYHNEGRLMTPEAAAEKILAYMEREDFGSRPVADVRDPV
ncbi:MAG: SDR family NAD(P)-dependent oxidoreductase [Burkholderiaceae bacterium]|nr:SDR family NAD(P)-dependent oxidoreductase [Burkholderiaceae bacterium]